MKDATAAFASLSLCAGILVSFCLWSERSAADEWKRAKPNTLIRLSPDPRCVLDCPETMTTEPTFTNWTTSTTAPVVHYGPSTTTTTLRDWPPISECLTERDGFAALHQREAADNRRCKKSLKKCRGRK